MKRLALLGLFSCLAACAVSQHARSPSVHGFDPVQLAELNAAFQQQALAGRLPGAVILVSRRGVIVHEAVIGYADIDTGASLKSDAIFRIFSMTKPVVTVASLQQIEEGHYTLDTPVAELLPEFAHVMVAGPDDLLRPPLTLMTVRHLMTHTAGYSYDDYPLLETAADLDGFVAAIAERPLGQDPGERFDYGLETDILGALVARVDGRPLDKILHDRVFGPLGMVDTGFCVPQDKLERLTTLYAYGDEPVLSRQDTPEVSAWSCPVVVYSGGGGLVSTAQDYWRFAEMLRRGGELGGVRVLSKDSASLIAAPQPGVDEAATTDWWMGGTDWGLNMAVVTDAAANDWLDVDGNYYWSGAASTYFWIDPANEMTAIFMTQVLRGEHPNTFKDDSRNLIYRAFVRPRRSPQ
jgi:CubicO group peptidase (beta-lactamase class C family)